MPNRTTFGYANTTIFSLPCLTASSDWQPALTNFLLLAYCYDIYRTGYRFDPRVVRETRNVNSMRDCEYACDSGSGFYCRGFAYYDDRRGHYGSGSGYNNGYNNGRGECQLVDRDPRDLSRYVSAMICVRRGGGERLCHYNARSAFISHFYTEW